MHNLSIYQPIIRLRIFCIICQMAMIIVFSLWSIPLCAQQQERISSDVPPGVEVARDIPYARYGDRTLLLDLYRPSSRGSNPLPTIVVIRGGGWRSGDKDGFAPMAAALAARGLAAVCIEYRASAEATFPAAVQDTKTAVRWIRSNAMSYGLDPDAIGAFGGSAGAHLALYLGVTAGQASLEGSGGYPDQSSAISAVVGLATPAQLTGNADGSGGGAAAQFVGTEYSEDPELWDFASPLTHISETSPPVMLIHSENDRVVAFSQSIQVAAKYGSVGVPVELALIPNAPHAFWNSTQWFDDTMDRSAAFFWRYLNANQ